MPTLLTAAVHESFPDLRSFADFDAAADAVLGFLQEQFGFQLWMITRTEGDDWFILNTRAQAGRIPIVAGDVLRWSDTLCKRMALDLGPRIAPDVDDFPIYATAPAAEQFGVAAYVGVPLAGPDGALYGTLCAVDSTPQLAPDSGMQPIVELCARLLSTLLDYERRVGSETRRRERVEEELDADVLTGVLSRRAWERLMAKEEARSRRNGAPACVIVGDLDDLKEVNDAQGHAAGDDLLLFAGRLLAAACRESDIVGRLGGDEFAVIAPETNASDGRRLLDRIRDVLAAADISMSLGLAPRDVRGGLAGARDAADRAMLAEKAMRKRGR